MIFTHKNINIKKFLQQINSIIIVLLALYTCACGDDSVTVVDEEFDPPRFIWRSVDIPYHGFAGLWGTDTNNIFLLNNNNNSLYKVDNGVTTVNIVSPDYYLTDLKGISNNEIYLFGTKFPGRKLSIIKYNGASFEFIDSEIDAIDEYPVRGCVRNSNEVWAISKGGIIKYDGSKLHYYLYDDPTLIPDLFYVSNENMIEYIGIRFDTAYTKQSLYRLKDTTFENVFTQYLYSYDTPHTYLAHLNGMKIGLQFNSSEQTICLDGFNGMNFYDAICFNKKIVYVAPTYGINPVGANLQNFLFLVEVSEDFLFVPPYRRGITHWNGSKLSLEMGLSYYASPSPFLNFLSNIIDENTYTVLQAYSEINIENSTLWIGNKK
ncbi:MAG: hypothetical protein J0M37_14940 [Ignavibacteria bacterium]|nr:hypothetical protein [Ignavibacteria bacterium]